MFRTTRTALAASLLLPSLLLFPGPAAAGEPEADTSSFLETIVRARGALEKEIFAPASDPLHTARLLVETGRFVEAESLLARIRPESEEALPVSLLLRASIALARYRFADAESALVRAERLRPGSDEAFRLRLALLEKREDYAAIDERTRARLDAEPRLAAALLGRADFDLALHRLDEAKGEYEEALAAARHPAEGVRALAGLMRIAEKRKEYDGAARLARRALGAGTPTPDLMNGIASVLLRLGEVSEAIDLTEEVLRWNRWNERAHYLLGNGYAGENYSELEASHPAAFPDSPVRPLVDTIRARIAAGKRREARRLLRVLKESRPRLAETDLLRGTLFWEEGEADSALASFAASLRLLPGYGRAHNGFARSMEQKRRRAAVHRSEDERAFDAAPLPSIPGIDAFVRNDGALSARHRKRVALSIAPWAALVPVLVESGATFYIKPLDERLSETPGQEVLRDLRIAYDSRLWDDVRGCGGYHTVTGIEDVERTIYRKYDTVLHELTHQVHAILTSAEKRRIDEAYRAAKEREAAGEKAFLSRYQGSSVWEYFAEGVNAFHNPRRDRYDTREIVKERLALLDPGLEKIVRQIEAGDAAARYAPALVVAAYDKIEQGEPAGAIPLLQKALDRSAGDEEALCALARTLNLLGRSDEAEAAAAGATRAHGGSAEPWIAAGEVAYHKTGSRSEQIAVLLRAREEVDREERVLVELALGEAYLGRGDLEKAEGSFAWVLAYRKDDPSAFWGLARAAGLGGDQEKADENFREAIRRRSGLAELRADYARFLTRAGRFDEAETEIAEARLLDRESSNVETAAGLLAIHRREWKGAKRRLTDALAFAPYNDMAAILLAHTWLAGGDPARAEEIVGPILRAVEEETPPSFIYVKKKGRYEEIHRYSAEERWMLFLTASELAATTGDTAAAERFRRERERTLH